MREREVAEIRAEGGETVGKPHHGAFDLYPSRSPHVNHNSERPRARSTEKKFDGTIDGRRRRTVPYI